MTICVYCGSSKGNNPSILKGATQLGTLLAKSNHQLVYGGSSLGVMGAIANSVMDHGGKVTGVIPRDLFSKEAAHTGITELITVDDMHQRKSKMADLADAFVALPGGFGTLEELFEIITWNQIGIINKPVVLYNIEGYFDPLIQMIDHAVSVGFIRPSNRSILKVSETPEQTLELCR